MPEAAPDPAELDLTFTPHRSLPPAGFALLMGGLVAVSFAGGIVLLAVGAWPVIGFLGLDVALVYWAFRASYRGAARSERLRLTRAALTLERPDPAGRAETLRLQPYWLRVEIEGAAAEPSRLWLASHGRRVAVGAFLAPAERARLAAALADALARLRAAPGA